MCFCGSLCEQIQKMAINEVKLLKSCSLTAQYKIVLRRLADKQLYTTLLTNCATKCQTQTRIPCQYTGYLYYRGLQKIGHRSLEPTVRQALLLDKLSFSTTHMYSKIALLAAPHAFHVSPELCSVICGQLPMCLHLCQAAEPSRPTKFLHGTMRNVDCQTHFTASKKICRSQCYCICSGSHILHAQLRIG